MTPFTMFTRVPVSSTWQQNHQRKAPIIADQVSMTPLTIGCCLQRDRQPESTLKNSVLSPRLMCQLISLILGVTQRTASGLSLSVEGGPLRRMLPPWSGVDMPQDTSGVDHSRLIRYRDNRGCRGAIRMWWWRYRWEWRNASERLDSPFIRPPLQVMISTGTCSRTFMNFYHFLEIKSSSFSFLTQSKTLWYLSALVICSIKKQLDVRDLYFCFQLLNIK